ncbi:hypothetical protein JMJ35_009722 [Cladonia borealis]|uniref:Arrestin-like N-terminal domain-containing protein n=1 Tax=Cladonia borealis TaxID=184061 RepID=A0AA39QU82_9LECA|nr:hypothetical protein JMJ35_009722 [Cladonia borealis]
MSLQMHLTPTYGFPGSILNGCIISRPEYGMHFIKRSLTVTLLGRSRTRVPSRSTAEDATREGSENFLKITQILYEQVPVVSDVLEDGESSQFRIRFPEDATFKHIQANPAKWPRTLELPEARTLPPTGEFGFGNTIEYSVKAGVINQVSGDEITTSIPIMFSLAREDIAPDPKLTNVVQARSLTDKQQDSNYCSIRLALSGPTTIVQDNSFPLVLKSLEIIEGGPSPKATVSLRSGFIQLLQHTVAWANDDYGHRWTEEHTIVSRDFFSNGGAPQITKEGTNLAALFLDPSVSRDFPPSFKCSNIERTYGLKVGLAVGFEERECEFSFDINPVAILPGELHCMARARQQDELWENPLEERPFPNAVNKLRQTLGI